MHQMLMLVLFKVLTLLGFGLRRIVKTFHPLLLRLLSLVITYVTLTMISISRRLVTVLAINNVKLDLVRIQLTTLFHGTSHGVVVYKVIGLGELVLLTLTVVTNLH